MEGLKMKRYSILKAIVATSVITILSTGTASAKKRDTNVDPESKSKVASFVCTVFKMGCAPTTLPAPSEKLEAKKEKPKK